MTRTIVTIVGARPQFNKATPVAAEIAAHARLREIIIHTGQHFDLLMPDVFLDDRRSQAHPPVARVARVKREATLLANHGRGDASLKVVQLLKH